MYILSSPGPSLEVSFEIIFMVAYFTGVSVNKHNAVWGWIQDGDIY